MAEIELPDNVPTKRVSLLKYTYTTIIMDVPEGTREAKLFISQSNNPNLQCELIIHEISD